MPKKTPSELLPVGGKTVMTTEVVRKPEEAFSVGCTDEEVGLGELPVYGFARKRPEKP